MCYAVGGQIIGVGAGQQSRVDCVKLAGRKVDTWHARLHPKVRSLPFKDTVKVRAAAWSCAVPCSFCFSFSFSFSFPPFVCSIFPLFFLARNPPPIARPRCLSKTVADRASSVEIAMHRRRARGPRRPILRLALPPALVLHPLVAFRSLSLFPHLFFPVFCHPNTSCACFFLRPY